jgi:opacity protein-like surface antigen
MKIRFYSSKIPVALAVALVSALSAAAEDTKDFKITDSSSGGNTSGPYLSGDAGLAIMQNMTSQSRLIQYHVGPRVDVRAGYDLPQNLAVELQAGFADNSWSAANSRSVPAGSFANVWTVPVMANGIYKHSFNNQWQVCGGLGAGVLISTLDVSEPGGPLNFNSTDCTFGYQAVAGINYLMNKHMEWELGYNFLGSLDHHGMAMGGLSQRALPICTPFS